MTLCGRKCALAAGMHGNNYFARRAEIELDVGYTAVWGTVVVGSMIKDIEQ